MVPLTAASGTVTCTVSCTCAPTAMLARAGVVAAFQVTVPAAMRPPLAATAPAASSAGSASVTTTRSAAARPPLRTVIVYRSVSPGSMKPPLRSSTTFSEPPRSPNASTMIVVASSAVGVAGLSVTSGAKPVDSTKAWLEMTVPSVRPGRIVARRVKVRLSPGASVPTVHSAAEPTSVPPTTVTSVSWAGIGSRTTTPCAGSVPVFEMAIAYSTVSPSWTAPPLRSVTVLVAVSRRGCATTLKMVALSSPRPFAASSVGTSAAPSTAMKAWLEIAVALAVPALIRARKRTVTAPAGPAATLASAGVVALLQVIVSVAKVPPSSTVMLSSVASETRSRTTTLAAGASPELVTTME